MFVGGAATERARSLSSYRDVRLVRLSKQLKIYDWHGSVYLLERNPTQSMRV